MRVVCSTVGADQQLDCLPVGTAGCVTHLGEAQVRALTVDDVILAVRLVPAIDDAFRSSALLVSAMRSSNVEPFTSER